MNKAQLSFEDEYKLSEMSIEQLREFQGKVESLIRKRESAKRDEVLLNIRQMMKDAGIQAQDVIGLVSGGKKSPGSHSRKGNGVRRKVVEPKYLNPATNQTWTGRGIAPKWIGNDRSKFLIKPASPANADPAQKASSPKAQAAKASAAKKAVA